MFTYANRHGVTHTGVSGAARLGNGFTTVNIEYVWCGFTVTDSKSGETREEVTVIPFN